VFLLLGRCGVFRSYRCSTVSLCGGGSFLLSCTWGMVFLLEERVRGGAFVQRSFFIGEKYPSDSFFFFSNGIFASTEVEIPSVRMKQFPSTSQLSHDFSFLKSGEHSVIDYLILVTPNDVSVLTHTPTLAPISYKARDSY